MSQLKKQSSKKIIQLETDLDSLKKENEKKQKQYQSDLANAQKTIINMTSIVDVKQKIANYLMKQ